MTGFGGAAGTAKDTVARVVVDRSSWPCGF